MGSACLAIHFGRFGRNASMRSDRLSGDRPLMPRSASTWSMYWRHAAGDYRLIGRHRTGFRACRPSRSPPPGSVPEKRATSDAEGRLKESDQPSRFYTDFAAHLHR